MHVLCFLAAAGHLAAAQSCLDLWIGDLSLNNHHRISLHDRALHLLKQGQQGKSGHLLRFDARQLHEPEGHIHLLCLQLLQEVAIRALPAQHLPRTHSNLSIDHLEQPASSLSVLLGRGPHLQEQDEDCDQVHQ